MHLSRHSAQFNFSVYATGPVVKCGWLTLDHLNSALAGDDNAGHFFVGTQDKQLRTAIGKVPAGASMFISVNGLHLEQPSIRQEKVVHQVTNKQGRGHLLRCSSFAAEFIGQGCCRVAGKACNH